MFFFFPNIPDIVAVAKHALKAILQINLIIVLSKKSILVLLVLFLCHMYPLECIHVIIAPQGVDDFLQHPDVTQNPFYLFHFWFLAYPKIDWQVPTVVLNLILRVHRLLLCFVSFMALGVKASTMVMLVFQNTPDKTKYWLQYCRA